MSEAATRTDADRSARDSDDRAARLRLGGRRRRKVCRFCVDADVTIDYKSPQTLKYFITDRGKILPRRITGNCAKHQRALALAIKRSRIIALMPFTATGR
ncbi:MAG: 30S ribosomal protein S18 [Deltaproteobacteria bacterium]|nr:MAG: 30S ribosomal protein S18 [Deltaproteobacteria bacterium]